MVTSTKAVLISTGQQYTKQYCMSIQIRYRSCNVLVPNSGSRYQRYQMLVSVMKTVPFLYRHVYCPPPPMEGVVVVVVAVVVVVVVVVVVTRATENWTLKIEAKMELGALNIWFWKDGTPQNRFGLGGWKKVPPKNILFNPQKAKKMGGGGGGGGGGGAKRRHTCITQHRGSALPGAKPMVGWSQDTWTLT